MFLQLESIEKSFDGLKAISNFSLSVNKGEIVGQIGPNGSGKTTLFNIISGFVLPDRGQVYFKSERITDLSAYKRAKLGIGRLFQEVRVFNKLKILENVLLARRNSKEETVLTPFLRRGKLKTNTKDDLSKAQFWLSFVGLDEKADSLAESLSFGQQKLLSLAMVLASEAKLLLLDEPTAGLDPEITQKILKLIKDLKNMGKTVIVIEHELNRVFDISDRIVLLSNGSKVYEGSPEELKNGSILREIYIGNYARK